MLLDPSMLVSLSSCCEGGHGLHLVFVSLGSVTCTQLHSAALAHRQTFTLCPTFLLPCCVLAWPPSTMLASIPYTHAALLFLS